VNVPTRSSAYAQMARLQHPSSPSLTAWRVTSISFPAWMASGSRNRFVSLPQNPQGSKRLIGTGRGGEPCSLAGNTFVGSFSHIMTEDTDAWFGRAVVPIVQLVTAL
jgi:hypothetical protein